MKYKIKQKLLLPYYVTNNLLKEELCQYIRKMESKDELKETDIKYRT